MLLVPLASLALGGPAGAFARSIAGSYAVALAVAMLVALIVTPALGSVLLRSGGERRTAPLDHLIDRNFHRLASRGLRAPRMVYAGVAVLLLAGLAVLPGLTTRSALPALQDRNLTIHWEAAPGTSLPEMARITALATRDLQTVPGVQDVGSHVGRALMADQPVNVNSAEMWVSLDSSADYGSTVEEIRQRVNAYPGMRADVSTYPADRVAAADLGVHDPLVVRVYGYDLDTLAAKAADVRQMLTSVRGVVHPVVEAQPVEPSVQIQVKLPAAQHYGITPGDVRRASATYFAGLPVGSLYEDQKIFDVVVWSAPQARLRPTDVSNLLIDTPHKGHVRLGDVANVTIHPAPAVIRHDNISRSLDVTASVSGRDVDDVLDEVKGRLASMPMPLEFHAEVFSNTTTYRTEHWHVAAIALAVALAILLLLHVAFGSWRLAGLLFLTFPLGVAGAVFATRWTGGLGSLGSLMGMLAVLGIVMRDGIVLLRNYQRRDADPGSPLTVAGSLAITRAHLTPVVLTALMTAAVVAPTAVLGVVAGTEVLHSFAAVVLAGLVSSTLYSTLVLPGLYLRLFERPAEMRG
jgi:Cu/Ag efflux pump CusA